MRLWLERESRAAVRSSHRCRDDRHWHAASDGRCHGARHVRPGGWTATDAVHPASQLAASAAYVLTLTGELRDVTGNALTNPGRSRSRRTRQRHGDAHRDGQHAVTTTRRTSVAARHPRRFQRADQSHLADVELVLSLQLPHQLADSRDDFDRAGSPERDADTGRAPRPLLVLFFYLSGFADIAGNAGSTGATYFITSGLEDTEPPTIVSIAPANAATVVPVNARVRVLMSEPLDGSRLRAIRLTPAVAGTTAVSADHLSFLFTPGADLAVSTRYAVRSAGCAIRPATRWRRSSAVPDEGFADGRHRGTDSRQLRPDQRRHRRLGERADRSRCERADRSFALIDTIRVFASFPLFGWIQLAGACTLSASGTVITFTPQVQSPGEAQILFYSNSMERRQTWPKLAASLARRSRPQRSRTPSRDRCHGDAPQRHGHWPAAA